MAVLAAENVSYTYQSKYQKVQALKNVSCTFEAGKFYAIIGQSGSGKTTLLSMLAGLGTPSDGEIIANGKTLKEIGSERHRRENVTVIYQSFNLFPTLNILENVMYPMQISKKPTKEAKIKAKELLNSVGLGDVDPRKLPAMLSGGQQQRVAIARALVTGPSIICMDEPLSNLDAKLRVQLRNELKKMQREFGITTIYVTHDQEEALTLSDRIAVFNKGYIEQIGTPNEIYNHSKTEFVCNFIGDINRVEAPIAAKMKLAAGQNHFIRLERLHVNKPKRDDEILIDGVVENIEYYGLYIKYYIDVGSQILKAIEKNDGINIYAPGEKVTVAMKPTDVMSYDAQ